MSQTSHQGNSSWAEYVLEGHPDKVADIAADAVVDAYLDADEDSHVACEVLVGNGLIAASGQITSQASVDIPEILRKAVRDIGYVSEEVGLDANSANIVSRFCPQSPYLLKALHAEGNRHSLRANDQAIVTGYACANSFGMVPPASFVSKRIALAIDQARHSRELPDLLPDGKVLVQISESDARVCVHTVIISVQHHHDSVPYALELALIEVVKKSVGVFGLSAPESVVINPPTGAFHFGGPAADSGMTGRKIIADAYGPSIPHGGGAWSGKDPTKIDRSGAYAARWIAKSLVLCGIARSALVSLTYGIGVSEPLDLVVTIEGATKTQELLVKKMVLDKFDLRPAAIIDRLSLRQPFYKKVTQTAHVGIDAALPWEKARDDL